MKRVNIILATDSKGKVSALHIGESVAEAKEVVNDAMKEGKLAEIRWIRNPAGKVFRPAIAKKKLAAARKAAKEAEAKAKAEAAETTTG